VVLDFGRKLAEGPTDEVKDDPEVIRAYLGVKKETEVTAESSKES
jgi:ABC-type uncharacterized transport system ATPase subunit